MDVITVAPTPKVVVSLGEPAYIPPGTLATYKMNYLQQAYLGTVTETSSTSQLDDAWVTAAAG